MGYKVNRYCNHFNFLSLIVRRGGGFRVKDIERFVLGGEEILRVSRNKKPITRLLWVFYLGLDTRQEEFDLEL